MEVLDKIEAFGHKNILCTHRTTIEITKDSNLTLNGDCILGVNASKSCSDLNENLTEYIWKGKRILVEIKVKHYKDTFYGYGHKELSLSHTHDIVFRKSDFICPRTILINCTKSASELDRELIKILQKKKEKFQIILRKP